MSLVLGSTAASSALPPSWYNVKDFGAVGDNSHDDTSAIQACINAVKAAVSSVTASMGGVTIYFPPGYYKTTAMLDCKSLAEVRFLGGSGRGGWGRLAADANPPTTIRFEPGNSSSVTGVHLGASTGCVWDGISIVMTASSNYTGKLMNWDALTAADVFGNRIQNMNLRCTGAVGAALLSLDGNIEFSADNVTFGDAGGGDQVQGFDAANGAAKWSNANSFRSCSFVGARRYSARNFGPQTTFIDCTFENSTGGVVAPIRQDSQGQPGCDSWSFTGCGFWDTTAGTNPWFSTTTATYAWVLTGCHFDVPPTAVAFDLSAHTGLVVQGCFFNAPGGGTPNVFKPAQNITNAVMNGCYVKSPAVDNHASVFV